MKPRGKSFQKGHVVTQEMREKIRQGHLGKKLSFETRRKMSVVRQKLYSGENNHFWKGGATAINDKIRTSIEYKLWRDAVYKRDKYTCRFCGQKGGNLEADHIKRFADYPELRFAIDNGRTLCVPCHKTTDTWGKKRKSIKC